MSLLTELANDARGLLLLKDWLGDGGAPVAQEKSNHRASICCGGNMGTPCPNNVEPNWWNKVKSAIADAICDELSLKHRFSIKTPYDDSLHMCKSCGCCLKLKVHTPIEHIKAHTPEAAMDGMPPYCWIKREISGSVES